MTGWQLQLASSLAKKEGFAKYSVLQQQWVGCFYSCLKSLQDYMKFFKVQPALQRAWVGGAGGGCQGGGWHPSLESPQGQQDAVKKFFCYLMYVQDLILYWDWLVIWLSSNPWAAWLFRTNCLPLQGGWLSGKMSREVGEAPEGSRVKLQVSAWSPLSQFGRSSR